MHSGYMDENKARKAIVDIGRRMYLKNMVVAYDGNISVRISEDLIVLTPSGVSKGFMDESMLTVVDLDGKLVKGDLAPSSEMKMHLLLYQKRPGVHCVCHAHPVFASSFAAAGIALDEPYLAEAVVSLGEVKVTEYADPGSEDVPKSIEPFILDYNALLLKNHGALTWGRSPTEAYNRMETLEQYAQITLNIKSLHPENSRLSRPQIDLLLKSRNKRGIDSGGYLQ